MPPQETFELWIALQDADALLLKEELISWFSDHGIDSFVEGQLENLDADHEEGSIEGIYERHGGGEAPLSIYSFEKSYLLEIKAGLDAQFGKKIITQLRSLSTKSWSEGWKESFQPIETDQFLILPPWLSGEVKHDKIEIVIDPGMAFGTGQHASTRLCLRAIEDYCKTHPTLDRALDVGCGSAILTIALKKLGAASVSACDIDQDALLSAAENLKRNHVTAELWPGSVEKASGTYNLVVANILFHVLERLLPQLARFSSDGLMLAGILHDQGDVLCAQAEELGFFLSKKYEEGDWVGLFLQKKRP